MSASDNHDKKKSAPAAEEPSAKRKRISGYVEDGEKEVLEAECERVEKVEELTPGSVAMGLLFSRAAKFHLRFDLRSLARYKKTHPRGEPKPARS